MNDHVYKKIINGVFRESVVVSRSGYSGILDLKTGIEIVKPEYNFIIRDGMTYIAKKDGKYYSIEPFNN